jgi:hypothetical protein
MEGVDYQDPAMWERFWPKVEITGFCWWWTASTSVGYGQFQVARRGGRGVCEKAHSVAYKMLVGPRPEGKIFDHLCRNRLCVNPDHLDPVTHVENALRSPLVRKPQRQYTRELCKSGRHRMSETAIPWGRSRTCGICRAEYSEDYEKGRRVRPVAQDCGGWLRSGKRVDSVDARGIR